MTPFDFTERDIEYFRDLDQEIPCACKYYFTEIKLVLANPDVYHIICPNCRAYLTQAMLYSNPILC